jgi:hypothetical protein
MLVWLVKNTSRLLVYLEKNCLYSLRRMLVWLRGQNVILGEFGVECNFGRICG